MDAVDAIRANDHLLIFCGPRSFIIGYAIRFNFCWALKDRVVCQKTEERKQKTKDKYYLRHYH